MLPRILSIVAVLLIAILSLDLFVLRGARTTRSSARAWDTAPIIGFLGAVLLALAFVESSRRDVVGAWLWGIVFGIVLSVCAGIVMLYRGNRAEPPRASGLRAWLRLVQTYGLTFLIAVLGVIVAVRLIGALLEVFLASAIGIVVLVVGASVFAAAWRKAQGEKPKA